MGMLRILAGAVLAIALLAMALPACAVHAANLTDPPEGTLSCSDPVLTAGQPTTITYVNPDMAGETIHILADGGDEGLDLIEITLDEDGSGSASWTPPAGWMSVEFIGPRDETLLRLID